jgi:hypothetical protein
MPSSAARRAAALVALACAAVVASPALAADPGRWREASRSTVPLEYWQGMASDPDRRLWFDGVFAGLYRTDDRLRERARAGLAIPPEVEAQTGYNHIGDIAWDRAERGRVLLPLECYRPNDPDPNPCKRGAIGVADPTMLRWRYHVELDPAEIPKAMWAAVSPDGLLLWTTSGRDLLAYRTSEIARARAAPAGAPLHAARRLVGASPLEGVTGGVFYGDRLLLAGHSAAGVEVWSVDLVRGTRRLEIQRPALGESEGLDVIGALGGGALHWLHRPPSGPTNVLLHYAPRGARRALRLIARLPPPVAGRRVRVRFRVMSGGRPVAGAVVRLRGEWALTGGGGHAALTVRLGRPGVVRASAERADLRPASVAIRVVRAVRRG